MKSTVSTPNMGIALTRKMNVRRLLWKACKLSNIAIYRLEHKGEVTVFVTSSTICWSIFRLFSSIATVVVVIHSVPSLIPAVKFICSYG